MRVLLLQLTAIMVAAAAACSSFGTAPDASPPADPDGGGLATDAMSAGDAGGGACTAKRCIDFESPAHQPPLFGFDAVTEGLEGGLALGGGFESATGLRAHALYGADAFGEIRLTPVPSFVHVTLRVRSDQRTANGSVSTHFLRLICNGGGSLSAKLTFDGDLTAQLEDVPGAVVTSYQDGEWMEVDVVAKLNASSQEMTLRHVGKGVEARVSSATRCGAPFELRVGSAIRGDGAGEFTLSVDDVRIDWK